MREDDYLYFGRSWDQLREQLLGEAIEAANDVCAEAAKNMENFATVPILVLRRLVTAATGNKIAHIVNLPADCPEPLIRAFQCAWDAAPPSTEQSKMGRLYYDAARVYLTALAKPLQPPEPQAHLPKPRVRRMRASDIAKPRVRVPAGRIGPATYAGVSG